MRLAKYPFLRALSVMFYALSALVAAVSVIASLDHAVHAVYGLSNIQIKVIILLSGLFACVAFAAVGELIESLINSARNLERIAQQAENISELTSQHMREEGAEPLAYTPSPSTPPHKPLEPGALNLNDPPPG